MEKKKHHDEMLKRTSGGTKLGQDEALIKEVESLNLDVPQEIMQRARLQDQVGQSEIIPPANCNERIFEGVD